MTETIVHCFIPSSLFIADKMPCNDHIVALELRRRTDFMNSNIGALLQANLRCAKENIAYLWIGLAQTTYVMRNLTQRNNTGAMIMATATFNNVLTEEVWSAEGSALWVKRAVLVVLGIALMVVSAKAKVLIPYTPVPITLGTFGVLTIGAAYGPRLGLATIVGYMLIGMLGFDVFAGSSAELSGMEYMMGGTGGYLVGYVLAIVALGYAARRGWDRNVLLMAVAMLIGTALIYIPGAAWLMNLYGFDLPTAISKGVTPFLVGDAIKLALAALLLPAVWKLVGKART